MKKVNPKSVEEELLKNHNIVTSSAGIDLIHYKSNPVAYFLANEINTIIYDEYMRGSYVDPHNALLNKIKFIFRMFETLDDAPLYKGNIEEFFYDAVEYHGVDVGVISKDYKPYKFALYTTYLVMGFLFELQGRASDAIECLYFAAIVKGQLQINRIKHYSQKRHSSEMAKVMHKSNPQRIKKSEAKKFIKECYFEWKQKEPSRYRGDEAFAQDMIEKTRDENGDLVINRPKTITEDWIRKIWRKELNS